MGDAIADLGVRLWCTFRACADDVYAWFVEVATPPEGLELLDRNGNRYTGVVVLDRGEVVAWFAFEADSGQRVEVSVHPYRGRSPHQSLLDPDPSLWDGDGNPFCR